MTPHLSTAAALLVPLLVTPVAPAVAEPTSNHVGQSAGLTGTHRTALGAARYEANVGQFAPGVRFLARSGTGTAELRDGELRFLPKGSGAPTLRLRFEGSQDPARYEPVDPLALVSTYIDLSGDDASVRHRAPSYRAVRVRGLYPGIDAVWHGHGDRLEYDVVVSPGADPSQVVLVFDRDVDTHFTPDGAIVVRQGDTELTQLPPVAWQEDSGERRRIDARFVALDGHRYRLHLDERDPRLSTVVDPVIYTTLVGREGSTEEPAGVLVDPDGFARVYGSSASTGFVYGIRPDGTLAYATHTTAEQCVGFDSGHRLADGAFTLVGWTVLGRRVFVTFEPDGLAVRRLLMGNDWLRSTTLAGGTDGTIYLYHWASCCGNSPFNHARHQLLRLRPNNQGPLEWVVLWDEDPTVVTNRVRALAVDFEGHIYAGGRRTNGYVLKTSAAGVKLFDTYLDTPENQTVTSVAPALDDVYVAGLRSDGSSVFVARISGSPGQEGVLQIVRTYAVPQADAVSVVRGRNDHQLYVSMCGAAGCTLSRLDPDLVVRWSEPIPRGTIGMDHRGVVYVASSESGDVRVQAVRSGPDSDDDGLPDEWEDSFGLNPTTAVDADGPTGDADGDGVSNAAELAAGTHPLGVASRLLAEGVVNSFFETQVALFNPGTASAIALLRIQPEGQTERAQRLEVPARTRVTVTSAELAALTTAPFSTHVESDEPVVVDRTVTWDASGYGAHAETASPAPATTWYLAEGSTAGPFSLFYLLQNPNATATTATVRYLRPGGLPPIEQTYALPPRSRTTIPVDHEGPALAATDVSAVITAPLPILVERAMYADLPGQPFAAGHGSAGVTAPQTAWFFGEGATGPFFDLFLLLANPSQTEAAQVALTYLLSTGQTYIKSYTVPANSRVTIWVDDEQVPADSGQRPLANVAVSTTVTASIPIVAERTMWWPGPELSAAFWTEAHNTAGATQPGVEWAVAEGEVGGPRQAETYLLIANVAWPPVEALVTLYFEDGTRVARTVPLAASSRTNVRVSDSFPEAAGRRFSATVEALGGGSVLVVERSIYTSTNGQVWNAGTNSLATRLR